MSRKFGEFTKDERRKILDKARQARKSRAKARFTMAKAIRYKCLDCSAGSRSEIARCDIIECSLWEYRFGKHPTKEMAETVKNEPIHGKDI